MKKPRHFKAVFDSKRRERIRALKHAGALSQRTLKRRRGKPITDATQVIEQIRQERVNELLNR